MDTKVFEDYQKQAYDWQQKLVDTWVDLLPTGKLPLTFPDSFETALKAQKEIVKNFFDVQEKTNQMMLDAQKQLWSDYFEAMQKMNPASASTTN